MSGLPEDDVFCVLPWAHLCASIDGVWGRCCVDNTMNYEYLYALESEPDFRLGPDSVGCLPQSRFAAANPDRAFGVTEAFNSEPVRRTRLAMLAGDRLEACTYCYAREAGGGESYRQKARGMVDIARVEEAVASTGSDGSVVGFPSYLDLRFGNSCNLACVMCGFPVSSRWGLEQHPSWSSSHIDPYRDDEGLWADLRENAHALRRVYFAGGEPFMQTGHFRMLDLLIESGAASQIHVTYHSNMTILPAGLFEQLAQFRLVEIGASCDGTGAVFEQIRTGAGWDVFVRNVRRAKEHVRVWLSVAPQRDNVMHLGDILEFARAEEIDVDLTNFVHSPGHLSVSNLDAPRKESADRCLAGLIDDCHARGEASTARQLGMLRTFLNTPDAAAPEAEAVT